MRRGGIENVDTSVTAAARPEGIVTGVTSGIGGAIARRLAQAGAVVGINFHSDPETAGKRAGEIRNTGGEALPLQADISKESEVQAMFSEYLRAFGRIDIVIANAGLQRDAPFIEMTIEQWRAVLDVNLSGQFLTAREGIRHIVQQNIDPAISRPPVRSS